MDEILAFLLIAFGTLGVFIGIPFLFIFLISSWTAYSRTIKWQKEKEKRIAAAEPDVEMDRLVSDEEEEEPLDSEDEAEINARKEEVKEDWNLTFSQKWKAELREIWTGTRARKAAENRAREEAAKQARQVARDILRFERRQERKNKRAQGGKAQEAKEDAVKEPDHTLPTYESVASSST